jgi:hypothetical protein
MGNGSFNRRENILVLYTQGFGKETNELISATLNRNFSLISY